MFLLKYAVISDKPALNLLRGKIITSHKTLGVFSLNYALMLEEHY